VAVDDGGQIQPAFPGGDIRDVTDEFLAGRRRGEVPAEQVGDAVSVAVLLGQHRAPGPRLAGLQAQLAHDAADELQAAGEAPAVELGVDASVSVGLVGGAEGVLDESGELGAAAGGRRFRAAAPVEES